MTFTVNAYYRTRALIVPPKDEEPTEVTLTAENREDAIWQLGHNPKLIGYTLDLDTLRVVGKQKGQQ